MSELYRPILQGFKEIAELKGNQEVINEVNRLLAEDSAKSRQTKVTGSRNFKVYPKSSKESK